MPPRRRCQVTCRDAVHGIGTGRLQFAAIDVRERGAVDQQIEVEPANTLYVGDDVRDVQAARAAGMPVLVAGYGYLGDGPLPEAWGADGIVDSAAGIGAWIRA